MISYCFEIEMGGEQKREDREEMEKRRDKIREVWPAWSS